MSTTKHVELAQSPSRAAPRRSLRTLSHALDKLVVPPPSRPSQDDASLPLARQPGTTFARPTASSLKRAATAAEFRSSAAKKARTGPPAIGSNSERRRMFFGARRGDTASKKTSLPVIAGSPVKQSRDAAAVDRDYPPEPERGGAAMAMAIAMGGASTESSTRSSNSSQKSSSSVRPAVAVASHAIHVDPSPSNKGGKQQPVPFSTLNPASSALHALSQSLSSLPQTPTPPKQRAVGTRAGLRSSSAAAGRESPCLPGAPVLNGNGGIRLGGNQAAGTAGGITNGLGGGGVKKPSLKILRQCAIFVDVRTEQGDDAGSLFVDMLKGLGAKIMGRLGQTCTHIVYKNGLPNTLARYRMLSEPKPVVVGIAWVVECAEKRTKVDEGRFKIDVDVINVACGNIKRRRSMLPKHLIPTSPDPEDDTGMKVPAGTDDDREGAVGVDASLPRRDLESSVGSRAEHVLAPLERVRRRRSILEGGQTRLVPMRL